MKFFFFHLMPYGALDLDYLDKHESPWVTLPNTYYDPKKGFELYHRYLDELELADQLGFDGVCVNEHHQTAYGMMPAPNILAGALARRTTNAKVCVLGRALPLINEPITIAEEFAMLDNLLGGRFITGFVRGIGCEYHASGANPAFSLERFREAHDLIIRAWTEPGPFEFEGKHFHLQYVNCWPRPYQEPHPPIWVPTQGSTETVEWAAHPDRKYNYLLTFSPIKSVQANMDNYRRMAEGYGYESTPDQLGWATPIYVAETDAIARKEAEQHIEDFFNKFLYSPMEYKMPPGYSSLGSYKKVMEQKMRVRMKHLSFDNLMEEGMFICGSPNTVVETLQKREQDMKFENLVAMLQFGALSAEMTDKNLRMFANEVMPKLQASSPQGARETIPAAE